MPNKKTAISAARNILSAAVMSAALAIPLSANAGNIIPGNWSWLMATGNFGTLRAGSVWAPEPSFALINRMSSVVQHFPAGEHRLEFRYFVVGSRPIGQ
jgi:hypothetical protein